MKIHEILGVKENEKFEIEGYGDVLFVVGGTDGLLKRQSGSGWYPEGIALLCRLINGTEKIIHIPRLTAEQRRALEWLQANGFKYITLNGGSGGALQAHKEIGKQPDECYRIWCMGEESILLGSRYKCYNALPSLIPDWRTPLNIADALAEAKRQEAGE